MVAGSCAKSGASDLGLLATRATPAAGGQEVLVSST